MRLVWDQEVGGSNPSTPTSMKGRIMRVAISVDEDVIKAFIKSGKAFTDFEKEWKYEQGDRAEIHLHDLKRAFEQAARELYKNIGV